MLFASEPFSVTELTQHIKALLEADDDLANVRVTGEISNLSRPVSGHVYFTLKDAGAQVKCVMWKTTANRLRQNAHNGDAVTVRGRISVYERDGTYQLYVESLVMSGSGDLYAEFERLKQMLQEEGLFDPSRKQRLPDFPKVLGIVTSPTGAAFQDIVNVLTRRYPLLSVILVPVLVQGEAAPAQIAQAIQALDANHQCDVILVTRGGGSLEELWAFNDERVVRAIVASQTPVVSGVGHEIDFTLTDFAADVRAPTPSAAAEMITPDASRLRQDIDGYSRRLEQVMLNQIEYEQHRLDTLKRALRLLSPRSQVANAKERVLQQQNRMYVALHRQIEIDRANLLGLNARLAAISPQATLDRGYAIVHRDRDGFVVRSVNEVNASELLIVRVSDGEFRVQGVQT